MYPSIGKKIREYRKELSIPPQLAHLDRLN